MSTILDANPNSSHLPNLPSKPSGTTTESSSPNSLSDNQPNPGLEFPQSALVGSLGDLARTLARGTEVPEEFYFVCALTMLGLMCGTKLRLDVAAECEPRLYTVLLGASADVKKSTALRRTISFFTEKVDFMGSLSLNEQIIYGVGSAEGLARKLNEQTNVLLCYDELQAFITKSSIEGSVLLQATTSLYEQTHWSSTVKSAKASIRVSDGHLSLLGCCTTETYSNMWSPEAIAIGFPNRLFLVSAERKVRVAWPPTPNVAELLALSDRVRKQLARLPLTFQITEEAKAVWDNCYLSLPHCEHTKRLDTLGFRLLGLIALCTDKEVVDIETVEVVCSILGYEFGIRVLTDPIDADNQIAKVEQKIRRTISARGPLSKRDLVRFSNASREGAWAFERAISAMKSTGEVISEKGLFRLAEVLK
jgi:hypothetical protein